MGRPRLFRDPVHLQLRYERADGEAVPVSGRPRLGWVMQRLVDRPEFQRLRHIRQNGLTNLVFHGAEHSRFSHSMGVAHVAESMFSYVCRNMDEPVNEEHLLATCVAALLHDVGHGPFSHTLEEILKAANVKFDHERMTQRIIMESGVRRVLDSIGARFAEDVSSYISKKRTEEHWRYKLVSSQLDADRLDYLLRDAMSAGLRGHGYDLVRLLDMLHHLDGKRIAVHWRGIETVEGYLVALDQMYRAVYFHHTVRAASVLLSSVLRRALDLAKKDPSGIFLDADPLKELMEKGDGCDLRTYLRLGEFQIWTLIERWQTHEDKVLSDLSMRLMTRQLFKTMEAPSGHFSDLQDLLERAKALARDKIPHCNEAVDELYVCVDDPIRTSYKRYDWRSEADDDQIWIVGIPDGKPCPIESYPKSKLIDGLKNTTYLPRLVFPNEIRDELYASQKGSKS